ncbi:MAG: GNAT family N-acetyltransferase [Actinomycetes bacterium]
MSEVEVLDPRVDPEPEYWAALRKRAGLRADWSWQVLAIQSWLARTPQLITVFLDGGEPRGVVWAAWVTAWTRRYRFTGRRHGGVGFLDVRSPHNSAVPGWWFADYAPGARPGQLRELFGEYVSAMRRELGIGLRGMLVRQLAEAELPEITGRFRKIRPIEPIGMLDTARHHGDADWLATLAKKRRWEMRKINRLVAEDPAIAVRVRAGADEDPVSLTRLLRHNSDKHQDVPILPLPQFGATLTALLSQPDVSTVDYHDPAAGRRVAVALLLDHPEWPVFRTWSALPVADGGARNLYLHVYGELARWSIATGKQGVVVGNKMPNLKASLCARMVTQFASSDPL